MCVGGGGGGGEVEGRGLNTHLKRWCVQINRLGGILSVQDSRAIHVYYYFSIYHYKYTNVTFVCLCVCAQCEDTGNHLTTYLIHLNLPLSCFSKSLDHERELCDFT